MAKLDVLNLLGEKVSDITLNKEFWEIEPNDAVLYDAIRLTKNSLRQGTHETKTRSDVRGGGKKPWRQKGSGRARQGSTRSPQWTGGGVVFGPHSRNYSFKMNRKERRLALKSALAYKFKDKEMIVIDDFNIETNKTKDMTNIMQKFDVKKNILIVVNELDENMILATRNLTNILLLQANEINTYDVVASDHMIITKEAIKAIEEVLS
ncbi:MAG: 50S ribosomal protein L4 [Bacilli bacterium]